MIECRQQGALYGLIAFGTTWFCWIAALVLGYEDMPFMTFVRWQFDSSNQLAAFIIFRLGVYGPLAASIFVTYRYHKGEGLKELWGRMIKWRVKLNWYLYLFLIPVIINLAVVLVGLIMGIPLQSFFRSSIPLNFVLIYFLYEVFTSGMEEPGWRGFLLDKLQSKYTAEKASWYLGIIWAVWHYPYVIYLYYSAGLVTTVFSLAGFTMAIIGQTFFFTWLYNNTKSIFIAILFHAWLNISMTMCLGDITISNPAMGIMPALITWGAVAILLKRYGGETLVKPV